jgi:hypothetical protein
MEIATEQFVAHNPERKQITQVIVSLSQNNLFFQKDKKILNETRIRSNY